MPGATEFTHIFGASSFASAFVDPMSAALEEQ